LAPGLLFLLGPLDPVSLGALKAVIGLAHECTSYPAAEGLYLRKIVPAWDCALTRLLCAAIQASAAASVSKLLTVVGLMSWSEIFTPNPPAASGTIS
jgi:hypothetical protein